MFTLSWLEPKKYQPGHLITTVGTRLKSEEQEMKTREQLIAERDAIDAQLADMDKPKWVPPDVTFHGANYDLELIIRILVKNKIDSGPFRNYIERCIYAWSAKEFVCPGPEPDWKDTGITKYVPCIHWGESPLKSNFANHLDVQELPVCAGTREDALKIAELFLPHFTQENE